VLAKRGEQRAVTRYKLYQIAVGTKAMHEAYMAMTYYSADDATVITSSGFKPSARRLSATTGVVLLLHSKVDRFDELLATGSRAREPA
jgi:restriction system protein